MVLIHTNDINLLNDLCSYFTVLITIAVGMTSFPPVKLKGSLSLGCSITSRHLPVSDVDLVCYHALSGPVCFILMIYSPNLASRKLFFHPNKCYCVVLDEATSALSEETECVFYSTLKSLNITLLSVGHRSSLKQVSSS